MDRPMRRPEFSLLALLVPFGVALLTIPAVAGPNAGGVLLVHANPSLVYTTDTTSYCGQSGLPACSLAVTSVPWDSNETTVFYVIAAFPDSSSPRLKALAWGVDWDDSRLVIVAHQSCADFDIPDGDWPAPGMGIGQSFVEVQEDILTEVYWLAAYVYGGQDTTTFRLRPHPVQGGVMVDDSEPPMEDEIAGFGAIGFGTDGITACPDPAGDSSGGGDQAGGDGLPPDGQDGGVEPDGAGGAPDDPYEPDGGLPLDDDPELQEDDLLTKVVSIQPDAASITLGDRSGAEVPIDDVDYMDEDLAWTLHATGAVSVAPEFPGSSPSDTIRTSLQGRQVRVPDLSGFYAVRFETPEAAIAAVPSLLDVSAVRSASPMWNGRVQTTIPDDPYFLTAPVPDPSCPGTVSECSSDAEWFLHQPTVPGRPSYGPFCAAAEPTNDINPPAGWPGPWHAQQTPTVIALIDTGILDSHEDLHIWPVPSYLQDTLRTHPNQDWCASHGTKMAGLSAATAGDSTGIVGVCPQCWIVDIETAGCIETACASHSDTLCASLNWNWHEKIYTLVTQGVDAWVPVINVETARTLPGYLTVSQVTALSYATELGYVVTAPHGNERSRTPAHVAPAGLPCVLGMGGATHDGRFWYSTTTCKPTSGATTPGPGIDLCVPASPGFFTTNPFPVSKPEYNYNDYYYWTNGQCSGASAIGAGAVGYLGTRYQHAVVTGGGGHGTPWWPTADEIMGVLESTARPWSEDPTNYVADSCATCTRSDYGHGMLDLGQAWKLFNLLYVGVDEFAEWGPLWNSGLQRDKAVGWYDAGVSITYRDFYAAQKTIRDFMVSKEVEIPSSRFASLGIGADRIAWINRNPSSLGDEVPWSILSYGPETTTGDAKRYQLAFTYMIPDASMGEIDQETGLVTVTGHNFAIITLDGQGNEVLDYLVPPEYFKIVYTEIGFSNDPAAVGDDLASRIARQRPLTIEPFPNPVSNDCVLRLRLAAPAEVTLSLFDASGRQVKQVVIGNVPSGATEVRIDLTDSDARALPNGIYWLRARAGEGLVTRQLVHLKP